MRRNAKQPHQISLANRAMHDCAITTLCSDLTKIKSNPLWSPYGTHDRTSDLDHKLNGSHL